MSTDNGSSASDDSTTSSAGDESQDQNQTLKIKPEDHIRAIDDLKKFKARSRELELQIQKLTSDQEDLKSSKLKEANDFKSLYEQASEKNKDWEAKYSKLKENTVYNEKYRAAQTALINAGLRKDAMKLLDKEDLSEIIVEYTSEGRVLMNGVDEYVDTFKKNYGGFAFEDKKQTKVNGGGGSNHGGSDQLTANDVIMIERKHGIASQEAKAAYEQFKKQKNR